MCSLWTYSWCWQPRPSRASLSWRVSRSPAPRRHHSLAIGRPLRPRRRRGEAPAGTTNDMAAEDTCSIRWPSSVRPLDNCWMNFSATSRPFLSQRAKPAF